MKKYNVVFCGTPDFSTPSLELLHNHPDIDLKAVVTMPDRPAGRGKNLKSPPVADFAKTNKIPLIQTENINKDAEGVKLLENSDIDFFVVLAFAQFLGSKVLSIPKIGCFNIHTSLLPKYRGAAPIQYALLNGDKTTGVSIQKMVKKMDAGDIALSSKISIAPSENGGQLYTRLKFQAALSLNEFISLLKSNKINYIEQDENFVSFAPTLSKTDGLIKFKEQTAVDIYNQIRALSPWPGTYSYLDKKRLKILEIKIEDSSKLTPGEIDISLGAIMIGTKTNNIRILSLQLEGKKVCTDTEFLNGAMNNQDKLNIHSEI